MFCVTLLRRISDRLQNYTSCVHRDNGGGNLLKNAEWGEGSQDYHRLIAGRYGRIGDDGSEFSVISGW